MRNIGLVSAAGIAMAAMAGTVAASAPPVMQSRAPVDFENLAIAGVQRERVQALMDQILFAVGEAERAGLSAEPAQQRIKRDLQYFIELRVSVLGQVGLNGGPELSPGQVSLALGAAHRGLVDTNQLRRGSDGDLAVSALLAARNAESRGETSRPSRNGNSSGSLDGRGAANTVPGNATTGQPATDAGPALSTPAPSMPGPSAPPADEPSAAADEEEVEAWEDEEGGVVNEDEDSDFEDEEYDEEEYEDEEYEDEDGDDDSNCEYQEEDSEDAAASECDEEDEGDDDE